MSKFNSRKEILDPSGIWKYEQLLGAKVKIKSLAVSNLFYTFNTSDNCTIKDIHFRVSIDGKTITIVELDQYPGKVFTWRDLEIQEITNPCILDEAICGEFLSGEDTCEDSGEIGE